MEPLRHIHHVGVLPLSSISDWYFPQVPDFTLMTVCYLRSHFSRDVLVCSVLEILCSSGLINFLFNAYCNQFYTFQCGIYCGDFTYLNMDLLQIIFMLLCFQCACHYLFNYWRVIISVTYHALSLHTRDTNLRIFNLLLN